jgi:uncharacterized protein (DUF486 family)
MPRPLESWTRFSNNGTERSRITPIRHRPIAAGPEPILPPAVSLQQQSGTRLMWTIILLIGSNVFMTCAWYGHLKYPHSPLWLAILASWGIAFFEYCLQVPANRLGYGEFNGAQLKTIQEIITLLVFAGFSVLYLGESLRWNHAAGFVCLVGAAFFMFKA